MIGHTKCDRRRRGPDQGGAGAAPQGAAADASRVDSQTPGARRPGSPLYVNTEPRPWVHGDDCRAAPGRRQRVRLRRHQFPRGARGVHRQLRRVGQAAASCSWPSELFIWSGESRAEIRAALVRLRGVLRDGARPRLCDLAYSAWQAARHRSGLTLAMVVSSLDELAGQR